MPFYLFSKYLLSISSVAVSVPGFGATEKYKIWPLPWSSSQSGGQIYINKQWEVLLQKDGPKLWDKRTRDDELSGELGFVFLLC